MQAFFWHKGTDMKPNSIRSRFQGQEIEKARTHPEPCTRLDTYKAGVPKGSSRLLTVLHPHNKTL